MNIDSRQLQAQVVGLLPAAAGQEFDALVADGRGLLQQVGHLLRRLRERPPGETLLDAHDAPNSLIVRGPAVARAAAGWCQHHPWLSTYAPLLRYEAGCPKSAGNTCRSISWCPPRPAPAAILGRPPDQLTGAAPNQAAAAPTRWCARGRINCASGRRPSTILTVARTFAGRQYGQRGGRVTGSNASDGSSRIGTTNRACSVPTRSPSRPNRGAPARNAV